MASAPPVLIALTGYGLERDVRRSEAAGFALHLVKPVDARRLSALVDGLMVLPPQAARNS
jgi:CheY-like chemotaxis protein